MLCIQLFYLVFSVLTVYPISPKSKSAFFLRISDILLLFTHTCPVTEFAVASSFKYGNSAATTFSYGTFGSKSATREQFQKAGICEKHGKLKCLHKRATYDIICRTLYTKKMKEDIEMKHVKTLSASTLKNKHEERRRGECQTS